MELEIHEQLATLGHPQRLALFRLLMRRYPDLVPAGELGLALGLKPSTTSAYLSALSGVGLVLSQRSGTSIRYGIDMAQVQGLFGTLFTDCCRGRPELCAPTGCDAAPRRPDRPLGVLFLCTGNSARSIFAEALLRDLGQGRFRVASAGTEPAEEPHPGALRMLQDQGHDITGLQAKPLTALDGRSFDIVVTVCNQAANEDCPARDGQPISGHWGMPDPVQAAETAPDPQAAFRAAYDTLRARITALVAQPLETLSRADLQQAIDQIGRALPETTP